MALPQARQPDDETYDVENCLVTTPESVGSTGELPRRVPGTSWVDDGKPHMPVGDLGPVLRSGGNMRVWLADLRRRAAGGGDLPL